MSNKIKPRQRTTDRTPRNYVAKDMILFGSNNAGPHANKKDKRVNNPKRHDWNER